MDEKFEEYLELLSEELCILTDKNEETPLNTLKALWLSSAGISVSAVKSESYQLPELTISQNNKLEELIRRRLENVPLAYLTGKQSFLEMEFHSGPGALIPRKETELLAKTAIKILQELDLLEVNVIDVGTGAGNVAISIASAVTNSHVYASDISEDAIMLAKKNAKLHNLSSRVSFFSGDLLQPLGHLELAGKIDLLACNPPYISSAKVSDMPAEICSFEPSEAFDGGAFGVNLICRLIADTKNMLCKNGYFVLEVGLGQAETLEKLLIKAGFYHSIKLINDEIGRPRVLVAQKI